MKPGPEFFLFPLYVIVISPWWKLVYLILLPEYQMFHACRNLDLLKPDHQEAIYLKIHSSLLPPCH